MNAIAKALKTVGLVAVLAALSGCATIEKAASFIQPADLQKLSAAACAGHQGAESVKLKATYALIGCRDGALVTVEYFPPPAPTPAPATP